MRLPAFPFQCQGPTTAPEFYYGFTRQEYAAIHLKQPSSGTPWLDDMILASKRDELAGQALQAMIASASQEERAKRLDGVIGCKLISEAAYYAADAMLAARKENK
jgi:hypothetical protein